MEGLGKYLFGDRIEEDQALKKIEGLIVDAIEMFDKSPFSSSTCWPYEIDGNNKNQIHNNKLSFSTTAMILASLNGLKNPSQSRSSFSYPKDVGFPSYGKKIPVTLTKKIKKATDRLLEEAGKNSTFICDSDTYGKNDIMSLGWLADILNNKDINSSITDKERNALCKKLIRFIYSKIDGALGGGDGSQIASAILKPGKSSVRCNANDSSYLLIRFTRIILSLHKGSLSCFEPKADQVTKMADIKNLLFKRFETRCHDHLSFYKIPDSRFDPAELAFCLEGMLLLQRDSVSKSLFTRVMEVMRKTQDTAPYWRTETPMISFEKGYALFPVSIETANSLLTSICIYTDSEDIYDTAATDHIDIIMRYWEWLKARRAMVASAGIAVDDMFGWHSEHINNPGLIHTWETSQVLEFLLAFGDLLRRHMSRKSLVLSHLSNERIKPRKLLNERFKIEFDKGVKVWECLENQFEPARVLAKTLGSIADKCSVYKQTGKHFYSSRNGGPEECSWSMLLYGPPGTGKSTLGKSLAAALNVPFITVTVSDFLAGGESEMENRAKMIFKVLELQPLAVVLFDEIDQFLLDRDSDIFRKQDSAFQFLTPGMLTKIAELRDSERVIFIIATNYEERIDPAIKRTGRIDHKLILLPPDGEQRIAIMSDLVENKIAKERKMYETAEPSELKNINSKVILLTKLKENIVKDKGDNLKKASLFLGFSDIKRAMTIESVDKLKKNLLKQGAAFKLVQYLKRFKDGEGAAAKLNLSRGPGEELAALIKEHDQCKPEKSAVKDDYDEFNIQLKAAGSNVDEICLVTASND